MNTRIALLGQPNSGKSTVYNALTGSRQHVGNWPGKTVERNDGFYTYKGARYTVTDLPGSYGLSGNSDEEVITAEFIKLGAGGPGMYSGGRVTAGAQHVHGGGVCRAG